jgi:hypothetical protein
MPNGEGSTKYEHIWREIQDLETEYHRFERLYNEERHKVAALETTVKVLRGMLEEKDNG